MAVSLSSEGRGGQEMSKTMSENNPAPSSDKQLAAVCGLYCEACSWFIATHEDPDKLHRLAAHFNWTEEEGRCYGCRSEKRLPYCGQCTMAACASERGIDFCSECSDYPCTDLRTFQAAMPHRIELWDNLERIKDVGYQQWLKEIKEHYVCPHCHTMNSAYDRQCRTCGHTPSCPYVSTHWQAIEHYFKNR